jgi:simple sugar transport system substrate-binding protein
MHSRTAALLAGVALLIGACNTSSTTAPESSGGTATSCSSTQYVPYVFHVPPSIPFISVFKKGMDQAAADFAGPPYCLKTEFLAPDKFDTAQMAQILDAALAKNPAGLVVAYPDASALQPGVERALGKGLPVITVNTGQEEALSIGVLTHVAEDEVSVSQLHGKLFADAGAKHVMCVNDNPGTSVLTVRCNGIEDSMTAAGGDSFEFPASNADSVQMKEALIAGLRAHPEVDAIAGLYSGDYQIGLQAIDAVGKTGQISVGIFDWQPGTQVLDDIKAGNILFASSQGPYLQGYIPIQLMALELAFHQIPNEHALTNTGGVIANKDNVDLYEALAAQGF